MEQEEKVLYVFTTSFTGLIIFFLLIGNMSYWYRYLIPVVFFITMLIPLYYKYYFKDVNKKKIVFNISLALVAITSVLLVYLSIFDVKNLTFRENVYQKIITELEKRDLTFGYTLNGNEHNLYRTLSNGKIQVIRLSDDGEEMDYWLNSKEWYSEDYYRGKVFFIRRNNDLSIALEQNYIDYFTIENFEIFVFDRNKYVLDNIIIGDYHEK